MSWPMTNLGEVASLERKSLLPEEIETGTSYLGLEHIESGGRILGYQRVGAGELQSNKFMFDPGTLLYGKLRPYLAKICIPDREGCCSTDILPIRPSQELDISYLKHVLLWKPYVDKANSLCSGANLPRISPSSLLGIEIPLPPLEEQRRIAAILDKASAIRRCSEKAARNAADIKASLFDEAFIAHDRHGHWEQIALGELCDVQGGLQVTSARSAMPIRVPYLRVANVLRGRLDLAEIKEINCSQPELGRTRLQHKDLLVVEGHGNPNEIGRVAMWTEQTGEMVHQNHLIRVRSKASSLDPEFLCFYLNSRMGRRHLLKRANTTSGLNTISTSVVKSAPIIVPPICEQRSFCETIRYIAQLEASLLVGSALHAQLSRSLLSESFDK
jgi:type I restriction enzyme S subunit